MPRIKVTGYLDTEDLPDAALDLSDDTGLSNAGYEWLNRITPREDFGPMMEIADLQEIELELEEDDA